MMEDKLEIVKKNRLQFLLSPKTVSLAIIAGCYLGLFQKKSVPYLAPFGEIFLTILKLTILPIMLSAVTLSIGKLMKSDMKGRYFVRVVSLFMASLIIASLIGAVGSLIVKPGGNLKQETLNRLGVVINSSDKGSEIEMALFEPYVPAEKETRLEQFLRQLIPSNIFQALSSDSTLKVLFFSIVFGITLALVKDKQAQKLFPALDAVFKTFQHMVHLMMYILPFGLVGLISSQLSLMSVDVLSSMINFVIMLLLVCAAVLSLCILIMWLKQRNTARFSLVQVIRALEEPLVISFSTGNTLASLPSTMEVMTTRFKLDEQSSDLLIPVGIILCRAGTALFFAAASVFVVQIYHAPFGIEEFGIVIAGSVIAAFASSGATGIAALSMLSLVLIPLKLPIEAVMVLFIVIDPIMNPVRTLINLCAVCATSVLIVNNVPAVGPD